MTVSSIEPVNTYVGNSTNTRFDFDFLIEDASELTVQYTDKDGIISILQNETDYTINEVGNKNGSYITFPIAGSTYSILKENEKISLILSLVIKQENEIRNSLFFNFDTLEWMFDYVIRILQIMNRKITRCVKVNEGSEQSADELVEALNQAQINAANSAADSLTSSVNAASSADNATSIKNETETIKNNVQNIYGNAVSLYTTMQELEEQTLDEITTGRTNIASDLSSALTSITNRAEELGEQYFNKADTNLSNLTSTGNSVVTQIVNNRLNSETRITSKYNSGKSWYRVWSDGFCAQGGEVTAAPSGPSVTLLKTYKDTNYTVIVQSKNNSYSSYGYGGVPQTGSSFIAYCKDSNRLSSWVTFGFIS